MVVKVDTQMRKIKRTIVKPKNKVQTVSMKKISMPEEYVDVKKLGFFKGMIAMSVIKQVFLAKDSMEQTQKIVVDYLDKMDNRFSDKQMNYLMRYFLHYLKFMGNVCVSKIRVKNGSAEPSSEL